MELIFANSLRKAEYLPKNHSGSPYREYTVKTGANSSLVVQNTFYIFYYEVFWKLFRHHDSFHLFHLHKNGSHFFFIFLFPFSITFCVFHLQSILHNIFLSVLIAELTRTNLMLGILCPVPQ